MKDKKMNITQEKWIKATIKVYLRTNSTPTEYWLDIIHNFINIINIHIQLITF